MTPVAAMHATLIGCAAYLKANAKKRVHHGTVPTDSGSALKHTPGTTYCFCPWSLELRHHHSIAGPHLPWFLEFLEFLELYR